MFLVRSLSFCVSPSSNNLQIPVVLYSVRKVMLPPNFNVLIWIRDSKIIEVEAVFIRIVTHHQDMQPWSAVSERTAMVDTIFKSCGRISYGGSVRILKFIQYDIITSGIIITGLEILPLLQRNALHRYNRYLHIILLHPHPSLPDRSASGSGNTVRSYTLPLVILEISNFSTVAKSVSTFCCVV